MRRICTIVAAACALLLALVVRLPAAPPATAQAVAPAGNACGPNPSPPDPADPAIRVTAPAAGSRLVSPLRLDGLARVFEGTVSIEVKDAAGGTLGGGFAQAEAGAPALAPFTATLLFAVTGETPVCVWMFEASARDGSPRNVVQVPLTLLPSTPRTEPVALFVGCNNIALTWPDATPAATVDAAVGPAGAVVAIWRYIAATARFVGYSPQFPDQSDLLTVDRLDAVFLCVASAGTLTRPAV